jgi:hypothetical protein
MKNSILALLSVLALLSACKKDDTSAVYDNYGNLEPGNYWLYDRYYLDSGSVLTLVPNVTDSNYVEKDTMINGNTFHKLMVAGVSTTGNSYTPHFLRDSLHYLVDWQGTIQFSSENFTDTLATLFQILEFNTPDTLAFVTMRMADDGFSVTTAAGTFNTKNYRQTYHMWPNYQKFGTERYQNRRYAKDVGVVEETVGFFIGSDRAIVRRLKAYGKE